MILPWSHSRETVLKMELSVSKWFKQGHIRECDSKTELRVWPLSHKIETDAVNSLVVNQNLHHILTLWEEMVITADSVDIAARPVTLHKPLWERKSDTGSAHHSNPFKIWVILDQIISNHHSFLNHLCWFLRLFSVTCFFFFFLHLFDKLFREMPNILAEMEQRACDGSLRPHYKKGDIVVTLWL